MKSAEEHSWARDLRHQIYQLTTILVVLVAVTAAYNLWSQISIDSDRERVNSQHLVTNNHYLKAMQDLGKILSILQSGGAQGGRSERPGNGVGLPTRDTREPELYFQVDQSIGAGIELEKQFADPAFAMLINKLERQLIPLSHAYDEYALFTRGDGNMPIIIDRLLTTLEQLVRLHSIARTQRLAQLQKMKNIQDLVFYALVLLMLSIAIIVARQGFASINRIIRRQVEAEDRIKVQAHFDDLTRLPNRLLALDRLSQMVLEAERNSSKVAVMFIDLDDFKKVNDVLGHVIGDRALVEVAQRLKRALRAGDTVGRLGGDEFIVLGKDIQDIHQVNRIADNLIRALDAPMSLEGNEVSLGASIGISIFPADGRGELELIRKADSAMYKSKEAGRNCYSYFTPSMNRDMSRQHTLETQLEQALERGELSLVFQPKVELRGRRIVGAEATLRWYSGKLGSVTPREFIPVAERTGLIVPIGEFVIAEALRMTRKWCREAMPDFRISINVSQRQFRDPGLIASLSRALVETGVVSANLEIELGEEALGNDNVHAGQVLNDLSDLGIVLTLDNFGTGYASLSSLLDFPFDMIKIDRDFIAGIDRDKKSLALNQSALAMAHALGIGVIANGVENHAQFTVLQQLECDLAQGYYFGKPMPAEQFSRVIQLQKDEAQSGPVIELARRPGIRRRN